jgi:uncharacterized lipoprotein NlpE involved in copper resistance
MKKLFIISLLIFTALSITGCNEKKQTNTTQEVSKKTVSAKNHAKQTAAKTVQKTIKKQEKNNKREKDREIERKFIPTP